MTRLTWGSALLLVLMLAACKSSATSSSGTPSSAASSSGAPATFTTATVNDPSFNNMLAETMTIPTGWKMDGTIMTAPCTTLPWPVYRAYSADSLTEIRQYPALGWHWSIANAPMPQGCLAMKQPMAASDFRTLSDHAARRRECGGRYACDAGLQPVGAALRRHAEPELREGYVCARKDADHGGHSRIAYSNA